jgi:hypothetical protein
MVLALSAAFSADVTVTHSFSISALVRARLDASKSRSVVATAAVVWEAVARSSADCQEASRDVRADALLATAAAAATRSTTSCISSWARSARSSRAARVRLRPDAARVFPEQDKDKPLFPEEPKDRRDNLFKQENIPKS